MALDVQPTTTDVARVPVEPRSPRRSFPWRGLLLVPVYVVCTVALLASLAVIGMRLFGIEPMVVRTSSMEPTIMAGDLILAKEISGPLELGQIYIHQSPETGGDTAHRLYSVGPQEGTWYTKGDNNEVRDEYVLSTEDFSREVVAWLPSMGYVNNALAQPLVRTLMFLAPLGFFLPSMLRSSRRRSSELPPTGEAVASHAPASDAPAAGASPEAAPAQTSEHLFHLTRLDKVLSALIALGIMGLLAARLVMGVTPVVVPPTTADAALTGGSMALIQPTNVAELAPGDVIYITMPGQDVPTFRVVTDPDPTAALAPATPGSDYVFSVDATDSPGAAPEAAQLAIGTTVPGIVTSVPRLGTILPVIATPTGFAGLLAVLGLFATMLLIRISLAGTHPKR